jgi:ATP-dependent DNA helicase RecG
MEKRGSGLKRICNETKALEAYKDDRRPVFKSSPSQFMTTIYSMEYDGQLNGQLNGQLSGDVDGDVNGDVNGDVISLRGVLKDIYLIVLNNPGIKIAQVAELRGKSESTVWKQLNELTKKGIIEYQGSDKTGGYYVK